MKGYGGFLSTGSVLAVAQTCGFSRSVGLNADCPELGETFRGVMKSQYEIAILARLVVIVLRGRKHETQGR